MTRNFWKIQASGNDFIVVMAQEFSSPENLGVFIKKLCKRKTGVGADGFIILKELTKSKFSWDFYNSDASSAEMCGNAARAVCKLIVEKLGGDKNTTLNTMVGPVELEYISEDKLKVKMPKREYLGEEGEGRIWDTGVPHLVFQKDFKDLNKTRDFAKEKRFPKSLNETGANVSFWCRESKLIKAISFERGVEDFTQACGTGASACALDILKQDNKKIGLVDLVLPGGIVSVEIEESSIYLIGDAQIIYKGIWSE